MVAQKQRKMSNPFKYPIPRGMSLSEATPQMLKRLRMFHLIGYTCVFLLCVSFFVPGLLISWLLLHWHGLLLVIATLVSGPIMIWLWIQIDDLLGEAHPKDDDGIICDFVSRDGDYIVNVGTGERTFQPLPKKKRKKFFLNL